MLKLQHCMSKATSITLCLSTGTPSVKVFQQIKNSRLVISYVVVAFNDKNLGPVFYYLSFQCN